VPAFNRGLKGAEKEESKVEEERRRRDSQGIPEGRIGSRINQGKNGIMASTISAELLQLMEGGVAIERETVKEGREVSSSLFPALEKGHFVISLNAAQGKGSPGRRGNGEGRGVGNLGGMWRNLLSDS